MIKTAIKRLLSLFDIEVIRKKALKFNHHAPHPFVYFYIDIVFDIGANEGQYAIDLRTKGFNGRIVSFEPLPAAHEIISSNCAADSLWTLHKRVAVGARSGVSKLNVAGNSMSSSLLPMLTSHLAAAPESAYVGATEVDVITLDSVFEHYAKGHNRVAVKLDTQGFEFEVLSGASDSLGKITSFVLELSTIPLYENERTYEWFFEFFRENGFSLWCLSPGFSDKKTGRLLQFDACFVKNDLIDNGSG